MESRELPDHLPAFIECLSGTCGFRFPVLDNNELRASISCPRCGNPTILGDPRLTKTTFSRHHTSRKPLQVVEVLVDNIRSAYNVGSIFRISDGAGIRHVHLCGLTPTPAHRSVLKTSLGAEKHVPWTFHANARLAALSFLEQGYHLWSLETGEETESIFESPYPSLEEPILLVIGNEVAGVDPAVLDLSEKRVYIPMRGQKESLNVSSAFGIAAYTVCLHLH